MEEFKLIVAGGRNFNDPKLLAKELLSLANETHQDRDVSIISGMAKGADMIAYDFAKKNHVQVYEYPANWYKYGQLDKSAGFRRNEQMANAADGLLAFWNGRSPGTKHMIDTMEKLGKPVYVINYK